MNDNYQLLDISREPPASGELVLLSDAMGNPGLILRPKSGVNSSRKGASVGIGAGVGTAASQASALWQRSQLYEIVITDPKLAEGIAKGTLEFVPYKFGEIFSAQIRTVNGPAVGQALLKQAGSALNYSVALASVFTAISSINAEIRMARIESTLADIQERIIAATDIEMASELELGIDNAKKLCSELVAIELSPQKLQENVLNLQRQDFDSRLRDLEQAANLNWIRSKNWLEHETKQLDVRTESAVERAKQMWTFYLLAIKLRILAAHLRKEKEKLRGGVNLEQHLQNQFRECCQQLNSSSKWISELQHKLKVLNDDRSFFSKAWDWFTGRSKKLRHALEDCTQFQEESDKAVQNALFATKKLRNYSRDRIAAQTTQEGEEHECVAEGRFENHQFVITKSRIASKMEAAL